MERLGQKNPELTYSRVRSIVVYYKGVIRLVRVESFFLRPTSESEQPASKRYTCKGRWTEQNKARWAVMGAATACVRSTPAPFFGLLFSIYPEQ